MALTKTKSLTISVVVLSVLLAVALVTTIVLAAFTFTAKASNTFTFAGQVTVTATSGVTSSGGWKAKLVNNAGALGTSLDSSTNTEITQGVALEPVKIKNTSSKKITVAVAVVIGTVSSKTKPTLYVGTTTAPARTTALIDSTSSSTAPNFANNGSAQYTPATLNGTSYKWATFDIDVNGETIVTKYINTDYLTDEVNKLSDCGFSATLYLAAVYTDGGNITQAISGAQSISTSWTVS